MKVRNAVLLLILALVSTQIAAQNRDTTMAGSARGTVRDSVLNHFLKSATVSIYTPGDTLLDYQVTNTVGAFRFNGLPVGKALKLVVSNVGYGTVDRRFSIDKSTKSIDFKTVYVAPKANLLDEVAVAPPPVRMNGDTLEFNAAAFELDSNAVVQDLMRKIPNITLWGDGKITVNGREIKSLLVNGREFMGGDAKISIENIPKNAVEKIQVYNTVDNPQNRQDSVLHMNLKLKKGKDRGYFGKIGGAFGTDRRYETDLNVNLFSPRAQVSLVGAGNNVNKIPGDIQTLLRNSTFKGVGVELDYMPDFRTSGLHRPRSAGYSLTYDFRDLAERTQRGNVLSSEYFLSNDQTQRGSETQTTTSLNDRSEITDWNSTAGLAENRAHRFRNSYRFSKDRHRFDFSQKLDLADNRSSSDNASTSSGADGSPVSRSGQTGRTDENNKSFEFKAGLGFYPTMWDIDRRLSGFDLDYALNINDNQKERENRTDFTSFLDGTRDRSFDRSYNDRRQSVAHHLRFGLTEVMKLLFGPRKFGWFEADIANSLRLTDRKGDSHVFDRDGISGQRVRNAQLTNSTAYHSLVYEPSLRLNRTISRRLTNRYHKSLSFSIDLKQQLFGQRNRSDKDFQNIARSYANFVPAASVSFADNRYGDHRRSGSLRYENKISVPGIGQIAPLTDSADVYFLREVNPGLKEERTETVSFDFKHNNDSKDDFEYRLGGRYGKVHDRISDSVWVDEQNVRTVFMVNNSNNRTLGLNGGLSKAVKLKNGELQLNYRSEFEHASNPNLTNGGADMWTTDRYDNNLRLHYTHGSALAVEAKQQLTHFASRPANGNGTTFRTGNSATSVSVSFLFAKKMRINSNIAISRLTSTGSADIRYNIWNASAAYRLLKGDNLEIKLSALDLLRQNTAVVHRNNGNGLITFGTQRVLRQYFTFGMAYFPRRFGKKR